MERLARDMEMFVPNVICVVAKPCSQTRIVAFQAPTRLSFCGIFFYLRMMKICPRASFPASECKQSHPQKKAQKN